MEFNWETIKPYLPYVVGGVAGLALVAGLKKGNNAGGASYQFVPFAYQPQALQSASTPKASTPTPTQQGALVPLTTGGTAANVGSVQRVGSPTQQQPQSTLYYRPTDSLNNGSYNFSDQLRLQAAQAQLDAQSRQQWLQFALGLGQLAGRLLPANAANRTNQPAPSQQPRTVPSSGGSSGASGGSQGNAQNAAQQAARARQQALARLGQWLTAQFYARQNALVSPATDINGNLITPADFGGLNDPNYYDLGDNFGGGWWDGWYDPQGYVDSFFSPGGLYYGDYEPQGYVDSYFTPGGLFDESYYADYYGYDYYSDPYGDNYG